MADKSYGSYPLTLPQNMWTLGRILEHQAETIPDKVYLQWHAQGPTWTYKESNRIVNTFANGYRKMGINKGDVVVLFMKNSTDLIWNWFALAKLGIIETAIDPNYKGNFLVHQVNTSGAKMAVVDWDCLGAFQNVEDRLENLEKIYVAPAGVINTKELPEFEKIQLLDMAEIPVTDESNPLSTVKPSDIMTILWTSGTEGLSKGVMKCHSDMTFYAYQAASLYDFTADDVMLGFNPLFHLAAKGFILYNTLVQGGKVVMYETFSASEMTERCLKSEATCCLLLGGTMGMWFKADEQPYDADIKMTRVCAVPTIHNILYDFQKRFGITSVTELYGQSEVNCAVMTPMGEPRKPGTAGVGDLEHYDILLVDPDTDEEVPVGQPGQFCVRNKMPFMINSGYWNEPQKSLDVRRNLWYHTGDLLKKDEEGYYYFLDRVKDSLRYKGHNISSLEVESSIKLMPSIQDCAIVAVSVAAEMGAGETELKACIVMKAGETLSGEEIIHFCDDNMPHYFIPRYVEFIDALPMTPTGKVQKRFLREKALNENTWDRIEAGCLLANEIARKERQKNKKNGVTAGNV